MARLFLVLCVLTACDTNNTDPAANQEGAIVFTDVYGTLQTIQQRALAAQPVAPVAQTIDYAGPCTLGGTSTMHGTYDDGGGTTNATYMFDATMTACMEAEATIDGAMTWNAAVSGSDTSPVDTETLNGTIMYVGPIYVANLGFHDLTITTTFAGTTATVIVTGTFTIGSTTYTVDPDTWAAYFGG